MDGTTLFSQETKSMDSPLGHPYSRKCQSTTSLSLAAHFPPVPPALPPIKVPRLGSSHSRSRSDSTMGSYSGPKTAFISFMDLPSPSDKPDISPPIVAPHGCPFVKHRSGISVILSGHKTGTLLPVYPSGSSISGVVVLSKLENVESLEVKVGDPFIRAIFEAHLRSSWKDRSRYARCRQASGAISSFHLIS